MFQIGPFSFPPKKEMNQSHKGGIDFHLGSENILDFPFFPSNVRQTADVDLGLQSLEDKDPLRAVSYNNRRVCFSLYIFLFSLFGLFKGLITPPPTSAPQLSAGSKPCGNKKDRPERQRKPLTRWGVDRPCSVRQLCRGHSC